MLIRLLHHSIAVAFPATSALWKTHSFSDAFLKKIEGILLVEKEKLKQELLTFTTKNPHVPGDYVASFPEYGNESDENAREIADYTVNKPLEMTLEKTLGDVVKSLDRLRRGVYGQRQAGVQMQR
ncbi:MAG: hypothetical protein AAB209_14430, partial [Bacteroidota bacterium]